MKNTNRQYSSGGKSRPDYQTSTQPNPKVKTTEVPDPSKEADTAPQSDTLQDRIKVSLQQLSDLAGYAMDDDEEGADFLKLLVSDTTKALADLFMAETETLVNEPDDPKIWRQQPAWDARKELRKEILDKARRKYGKD